MESRPQRPSRGVPVERVRGEHPDESWRADALGKSPHSRLLDEIREPLEDHDPERSREICAAVCRGALRDFAPALILLPAVTRERAQALAAYAITLFDFARQTGLEGERLAQINRWEFNLEEALSGRPPGQPVFVQMAAEEARLAWPREPLDRLAALARQRVAAPRARSHGEQQERARGLGGALAAALLGEPLDPEVAKLAGALVRVAALQALGEGLRRSAPALAEEDLPDERHTGLPLTERQLTNAVQNECDRLRVRLRGNPRAVPVARQGKRAVRFLHGAARALLERIERLGSAVVAQPPSLGAGTRIGLLVRARLF